MFEVLSPGNRLAEMIAKFQFYERHGVEEYYVYNPDKQELTAWVRAEGELRQVDEPIGWTSPHLGIRFEMGAEELIIFRPDGRPFASYLEVCERAETERQRAETEKKRAETEKKRAEEARRQLQSSQLTIERLRQQLLAAGIEPDAVAK